MMKVLIGINPKGHIHLATDELDGLANTGMLCRPIRYGRKNYSVNGVIRRLFDTVSNSFNIISTLYRFSPDILYLNSRFEPVASVRDFITLFLVKCFYYKEINIVIKSHGSDMSVFTSSSLLYRRVIIPYLIRHVDLWLFLSKEEKTIVKQHNWRMAEKVFVTGNIIEPSRLISNDDFRIKYHLNNGKLRILFIGHVVYEKGVFEFLKAVPLVERKDKCDFILVGDGEDLGEAKELAIDLGVTSYIRFLGWVEEGETEHFYDCVDILVCPSFQGEDFPMVLFKAIASGLPVITTRMRTAIDYLTMPENVIWVEPKNEKQVAEALNELIKNDELRNNMSTNNRKLATQFSRDKVCDEMYEAFMSLQ
ncbi:Glycosyltransferase involved in cell wall bisynthesis [Hydrobacter penzbergensis]|uniref:Glycosyltransferase involved in cell wall bisynthesis n=1 Tax=Hydrobacter penzbergensis TaxID=1235997 RepID=A0A8X8IAS4_9BACT|nr:glycosyltransferase family 4 protein [Hydrobacter penzbergensis]SDW53594.1 Glycosyltransferase involved in cell wall bisynthesis [Hydrobacter penzbergensis]